MSKVDWQFTIGVLLAILGLGMIFMLFIPEISRERQTLWGIAGVIAFCNGFLLLAFPEVGRLIRELARRKR